MVHCAYQGLSSYDFKKKKKNFCLIIFFALINSVDPDENVASCSISTGYSLFAKVLVCGFPVYKG